MYIFHKRCHDSDNQLFFPHHLFLNLPLFIGDLHPLARRQLIHQRQDMGIGESGQGHVAHVAQNPPRAEYLQGAFINCLITYFRRHARVGVVEKYFSISAELCGLCMQWSSICWGGTSRYASFCRSIWRRSFPEFCYGMEPVGLHGSWPEDRLAVNHYLFASFYGSNNEPCLLPESLKNQTRPSHVPGPTWRNAAYLAQPSFITRQSLADSHTLNIKWHQPRFNENVSKRTSRSPG